MMELSGNAGEFGGAAIAVRNILRREGVRGLFAGYGSFLLRDLPFDAIEFVAYEQLKSMYKVGAPESTKHPSGCTPKPLRCRGSIYCHMKTDMSLARFLKIAHHMSLKV